MPVRALPEGCANAPTAHRSHRAISRKLPAINGASEEYEANKHNEQGIKASAMSTCLNTGVMRMAIQTIATEANRFASRPAEKTLIAPTPQARAMPTPSACAPYDAKQLGTVLMYVARVRCSGSSDNDHTFRKSAV